MKKVIKIITLGAILTTSSLVAGKNVIPVVVPVEPIPVSITPVPVYVGLGLTWAGVSRDCICRADVIERVKDSVYGGAVRVGWDINQYLGLEARAIKALWEKEFAEVTHYGLYLKPMMPVSSQVNIYGLLGYGRTEVVNDCDTLYQEYASSGFNYGIGAEYDLSEEISEGEYPRDFDGAGDQEEGWGLWLDYQNLFHNKGEDNHKINVVNFGATYDF